MVSATPCLLYLQERDLVVIVQEAGWASGLVWMGAEKSHPYWDLNLRLSSP